MKLNYLLLPIISASAALSGGNPHESCHCLSDAEADNLIKSYITVFQGIPPKGNVKTVQALATTTFASDIKMYSISFLWLRSYKDPYDDYPPYIDGIQKFRAQYDHVHTPYKILAKSHDCSSISIAWQGNFTNLFGLDPAYGLTAGVDLAFLKPGTKMIGKIFSEANSLQAALATGGHVTNNTDLTQCPRIF